MSNEDQFLIVDQKEQTKQKISCSKYILSVFLLKNIVYHTMPTLSSMMMIIIIVMMFTSCILDTYWYVCRITIIIDDDNDDVNNFFFIEQIRAIDFFLFHFDWLEHTMTMTTTTAHIHRDWNIYFIQASKIKKKTKQSTTHGLLLVLNVHI